MPKPEAPVIRTLYRPIIAGRYITIDWDELSDLADKADKASAGGDYAAGVHDVLRWLSDGGPTPSLVQLLGREVNTPCASSAT